MQVATAQGAVAAVQYLQASWTSARPEEARAAFGFDPSSGVLQCYQISRNAALCAAQREASRRRMPWVCIPAFAADSRASAACCPLKDDVRLSYLSPFSSAGTCEGDVGLARGKRSLGRRFSGGALSARLTLALPKSHLLASSFSWSLRTRQFPPPKSASSATEIVSSTSDEIKPREEPWGFVKAKVAVFVSGGGSNFRKIHEAMLAGEIYGEIAVVVSDKPECGGCVYAREHGIKVLAFPQGKFAPDGLSPEALVASLRELLIDYIVLAGYLRLLPGGLVESYPRAILNIHPALLPAFGGKGYYGMKVHEAVIRSGARFSGPTVHFVDEKYDNGPIAAQRVVPVLPSDSPKDLQARVLAEEHQLYVQVVAALCEGRVVWRDDGVPLLRRSWDDCDYL